MKREKAMTILGICHTDGNGYWSRRAAAIPVRRLALGSPGELLAYFSTADWDTTKDGLIYTDDRWLSEFRKVLSELGFSTEAVDAVHYSEQGMQGDDYVSLDVGHEFLREVAPILPRLAA